MTRPLLLSLALAIAACSGAMDVPDAGQPDSGPVLHDGGRDGGHDAGPDGGPVPTCTTGCGIAELALGVATTCARRENGSVLCWGHGQEGQLGDGRMRHESCAPVGGNPVDCSSTAVAVRLNDAGARPLLDDAIQISAQGALSTCALRESGEVWCWGLETTPNPVGSMREYWLVGEHVETFGGNTAVSDGWPHICMIQGDDDRVVCYGDNDSGELGIGILGVLLDPDRTMPVLSSDGATPLLGALEIDAAGFGGLTCARTSSNVFCWGSNREGQLGDTASHSSCTPSGVQTYDCSQHAVTVGGTATPLADVAQLAVGVAHVCALRSGASAGQVQCWGDNRGGQTGQTPPPPAGDPTACAGVTCGTDEVCSGAGTCRPAGLVSVPLPMTVALPSAAAEVAAGGSFSCARLTDGTVWCWGTNRYSQLGDATESHGPNCTIGDESPDCSGAPVQVVGIDDATHLALGNSHACVIHATGDLSCWGSNDNKQLGDGTRSDGVGTPVHVTAIPE